MKKKVFAGKTVIRFAICAALTIASTTLASAQRPLVNGARRPSTKPAAVEFLSPQQIIVPAGKAAKLALHFRIEPGLHINSHTPRQRELIPTSYSIPEGEGVRLDRAVYPPGTEFSLPLDPNTKFSVYTGEFIIEARVVAATGDHLIEARLRYQACDNNACLPPQTAAATIDVIGK
jgi:hypothetical protein